MTDVRPAREALPETPGGDAAPTPAVDTAVAAALPTIVAGLHALVYGRWVVDDAGITLAYARSIATGFGPVLQPGDAPVEGWSDPAWLGLLVGARGLGLVDSGTWLGVPDVVAFPKLVALLCCFGIFACFHRMARLVTTSPLTLTVLAGTVTAAVPSFVVWMFSGLENPLLALVVVTLATVITVAVAEGDLLAPRVSVSAGALAALAALTRPDGIVYLAVAPLAILIFARGRGGPAALATALSTAVAVVPLAIYELWRVVTFGDLLPNTARAKDQGWPTLATLMRPGELVGAVGWLAAAVLVSAVTLVLSRSSPARTVVGALLVPFGTSVAAYALLAPDWMALFRFATPVWPLAALVLGVATSHLLAGAGRRRRTAAVGLALVALVSAGSWIPIAQEFRRAPTVPLCAVAMTYGYAVNAVADDLGVRQGSLLGVDAGGTALTSRLRFVDFAGLTDAAIARYWSGNDMVGLRDHVFVDVRPTIIRLFPGWNFTEESGLLRDPRLATDYVIVGEPGGAQLWVRRELVRDPQHVDEIRATVAVISADVQSAQLRSGGTGWVCGPVLAPGASSGGQS